MQYLASNIQKQFWLLQEFNPESSAYNVPILFKIRGEVDTTLLSDCINQLIAEHEILRTKFSIINGSLYQIVENPFPIEIAIHKMDVSSDNPQSSSLQSNLVGEASKLFNTSELPLIRFSLFQITETLSYLLIVFHHLISDLETMSIFLKELSNKYNADSSFDSDFRDNDVPQYSVFSEWENTYMNSSEFNQSIEYWLSSIPVDNLVLNLPIDYPREDFKSNEGNEYYFKFDIKKTEQIEVFARNHKVNSFIILLSAFYITLARFCHQSTVILGVPLSNRKNTFTKGVLGCFANILPIPLTINSQETFLDIVQTLRKKILLAHRHQEIPFEKIVEALNPKRNSSYNPVYQVGFTMEPPIELDLTELECQRVDVYRGSPQLDIFCILRLEDGKYFGKFEYNKAIFKEESIELLDGLYADTIESLLESSQTTLANKSLDALSISPNIDISKPNELPTHQLEIIISSTFTSEPIETYLNTILHKLNFQNRIAFAPYNQIFQQLLDPGSLLSNNTQGVNIILLRFEDLFTEFDTEYSEEKISALLADVNQKVTDFTESVQVCANNNTAPFIIVLCPLAPKLYQQQVFCNQVQSWEKIISDNLAGSGNVYIVTSNDLFSISIDDYYEPLGEKIGHIPYTNDFFFILAMTISRRIHAILKKPYKVIVLDCDNTLWSGVVGEVGINGLKITSNNRFLQEFVKDQYKKGMVVCLCSKNIEQDVIQVLSKRSDMLLTENLIAAYKINWNPKSQNIFELSQELNLGLDSFIFIDDNPVECAEVQARFPEVLTIQFPDKLESTKSLFNSLWVFDQLKVTSEDLKRSDFYRTDIQRVRLKSQSLSFGEFIAKLNLTIDIHKTKDNEIARSSQLTHRVNQFNFTTIRRSESELTNLINTDGIFCYTIKVSDRFGDYGHVGMLLYKIQEDHLFVDSFILSCRSLGKGVEHAMAQLLGVEALGHNLSYVVIKFSPTEKNLPAKAFLDSIVTEFASNHDEGIVYRVPSEYMANIKFTPDQISQIQPKEPSPIQSKQNYQRTFSNALMIDIAHASQSFQSLYQFFFPHKIRQRETTRDPSKDNFHSDRSSKKTETIVSEIWRDVLETENINRHDQFFDIGGKSILIPQIVIQLKKKHGIDIRIVSLFQYPTIASLSAFIDSQLLNTQPVEPTTESNKFLMKQKARAQKMRQKLRR